MEDEKTLTLSSVLSAAGICPAPLVEKWLAERDEHAPRFEAAAKAKNTLRYNGPFMKQSEFSSALDEQYGIQSSSAASTQRVLDEADGGPMTALIHSSGGDYDEFAAIRTLWNQYRATNSVEINSIAIGSAYSAAAFLFMAGDERKIDRLATLMFHKVRAWGGGDDDGHRTIADTLSARDKSVATWLSGKSRLTPDDYLRKVGAGDWFLSAEEAIDLGLATGYAEDEDGLEEEAEESTDEGLEAKAETPSLAAPTAHLTFALMRRASVHSHDPAGR